MLSHLRFHRKGASNPPSPIPEHQQSFLPFANRESPSTSNATLQLDGQSASSNSSHAPMLPPIARVASVESNIGRDGREDSAAANQPQQTQRSRYKGDVGFIGGAALRNFHRSKDGKLPARRAGSLEVADGASSDDGSRRPLSSEDHRSSRFTKDYRAKKLVPPSMPIDTDALKTINTQTRASETRPRHTTPFVPPGGPNVASVDTQRGKKGLPFLKIPMSTLLMRRRHNQNAPELRPLPLRKKEDEPLYDPRIKGTRVHDFSTPRKLKDVGALSSSLTQPPSNAQALAAQDHPSVSRATSHNVCATEVADRNTRKASPTKQMSQKPSRSPSLTSKNIACDGNYDLQATPQVPNESSNSSLAQSSLKPEDIESPDSALGKSGSQKLVGSKHASTSEILSTIPRHMKSTSSRFSFDMVGAAKEEKLLEERHRQRQLERSSVDEGGSRDSRFDESDADAYDYDAMMDDDGLEERIPGVNTDLEEDIPGVNVDCEEFPTGSDEDVGYQAISIAAPCEHDEEMDPENDQENFAGFVFQRSNASSSLTSPHSISMMATPRDADGNVIGFAVSRDTPASLTFPQSPLAQELKSQIREADPASGLGIEGVNPASWDPTCDLSDHDDLYYDDGVVGYEAEFAEDLASAPSVSEHPFDESIFDNNDTDRFGRPVPGAFQNAQCKGRAPQSDSVQQESDTLSRLSAHSTSSRSTAHTSLSATYQGEMDSRQGVAKVLNSELQTAAPETFVGQRYEVDYQAALAAAAYEAAASGKFQRNSSSSCASLGGHDDSGMTAGHEDTLGGFEEANDGVDFDEVDFDDDAIIAEANASALANDSDGWYGQEFGFYSAPPTSSFTVRDSAASDVKVYEYANGGFFGPEGFAGLDRSTSGRMISREPNLTPITERSEYSNRNSLMSLGFPPLSTSTPTVQSPGLAQLAMMADSGDDQMTLSALLRLRSRAWGGSQVSLVSSRDGSPRSERGEMHSALWPVASPGDLGSSGFMQGDKLPFIPPQSCQYESDSGSSTGSPTMTMPIVGSGLDQKATILDEVPLQDASCHGAAASSSSHQELMTEVTGAHASNSRDPARSVPSETLSHEALRYSGGHASNTPVGQFSKGHGHKGSSDSVSYVKEEDSGETRWVLERRRTADSGEVEVVERAFIAGRQI